jgi:hypothetical protein
MIYDSIAFEEEKSKFKVKIEPAFLKIIVPSDEILVLDRDAIIYREKALIMDKKMIPPAINRLKNAFPDRHIEDTKRYEKLWNVNRQKLEKEFDNR